VLIPEENQKDLADVPDYVKKKVTFVPVKDMDDVVRILFSARPRKKLVPKKRVRRERSVVLQQA